MRGVSLHIFFFFFFVIFGSIVFASDGEKLLSAIRERETSLAMELIEQGADINAKDEKQMTALMWAIFRREKEIVRLLLEKGAEVNVRSKYSLSRAPDVSALELAVFRKEVEIVELLVEYGADLHAVNKEGINVMYIAVRTRHVPTVSYLLEQGLTVPKKHLPFLLYFVLRQEEKDSKDHFASVREVNFVDFLLEKGFVFESPDQLRKRGKEYEDLPERVEDMIVYLEKVQVRVDEKRREQHFIDSIVSLTPEQRDADPDFRYVVSYPKVRDKYGKWSTETVVKKIPREKYETYYLDNNLNGGAWPACLTGFYFIFLLWVFYRKHPAWRKYWYVVVLVTLPFTAIIWLTFRSLVFNANELHTRRTGTMHEATVTYRPERRKSVSYKTPASYYWAYPATFHVFISDNVKYVIQGNHTTFDPGGHDHGVERVFILMNDSGDKVAVDIPWHTRENIIVMINSVLVLILFYTVFAGKFDWIIKRMADRRGEQVEGK